ncbi:hypothetical protein WJX81_008228 [Elliptochloris bilobata]|uniref:DNA annealing helicase and endonuclease ZRANB3 n=1 Tax=Elliptochloris bilobata TaxID=381761 RepID=A0AAW1SDW5_9CHLO
MRWSLQLLARVPVSVAKGTGVHCRHYVVRPQLRRSRQSPSSGPGSGLGLQALQQRACEFAEHVFARGPPPASHRCPGVYKAGGHGCGAPLRFAPICLGPGQVIERWRCLRNSDGCGYTDFPLPRLRWPQLALEAVSPHAFQVQVAPGAEEAIAFCGGLRALLAAIGVPASLELPAAPVRMAWMHYAGVVSVLRGRRHGLRNLLAPAGLVPEGTLGALRGACSHEGSGEVERRFAALPAHLAAALLPFQREGVRFGLARRGRMLLADEMGVGKTVQAIALLACYQDEWPALVVAPASLRLVWAEELARWLPHLRPAHVHVVEGRADRLPPKHAFQVVITSYDMLARLTCAACRGGGGGGGARKTCTGSECMAGAGWRMVVVDESHSLRTVDRAAGAPTTEAAVAAVSAARRAVLLSGTPSLSRPFDLFRQVEALRPGLLGGARERFAARYCARRLVPVSNGDPGRLRWDNGGLAHAAELHALLKQEVMLRRLKSEVMAQLPPKRRQVVRLPPPAHAEWPRAAGDEEGGGPASKDAGPKFIVFAHHRTVMAKLAAALDGAAAGGGRRWAGVPFVAIDGSTDAVDRRAACRRFRDDPAVRMALLSITAAGTGLDFSAASAVVFAELPDEVALVRQAEDRAHRHGQRRAVNVYFLIARGTSDERRWQLLDRSLERVTAVHDGGAAGGGNGPGDARGIALDAVCEAGGARGWGSAVAEDKAALPDVVGATDDERPKVWFEVSAHTNRMHFHAAADGSAPLGLSLPLELLQLAAVAALPPALTNLLDAIDRRREDGCTHVGAAGVLALDAGVTRAQAAGWIAEAREFAAEWAELRAVFQSRLFGVCVRSPLQEVLAELEAAAANAGAYGLSKERYLRGGQAAAPLPPGAAWHTVCVRYTRRASTVAYQQALSDVLGRLCIHCLQPVLGAPAPPDAVLDGAGALFCGPACEAAWCLRSSGGALRRALFRLERGVCQICRLDCHALLQRLRNVEKGAARWQERRWRRLREAAPAWEARGAKAAGERLVTQAVAGNAWHADHILPVFRGGGLCTLENLRTLCVVCHQAVTKRQARERADARHMVAQSTLDAFIIRPRSAGQGSADPDPDPANAAASHAAGGRA